ncbi:MAG: inorganic phosphate transporter [Methylococcales bacterium]|nr:inorganic phosphate transporter [Methylococcales bacterium]MDP3840327.1 inorganic phosphate transporter [Methylococcales bacterium]
MTFLSILIIATCFLAYANGANDNFKGVATLFGSGTSSYRNAISWATITAFAGSICSIFLAEKLLKNFSGKGLVPDAVAISPDFLLAVSVGAGITVLVAALKGFPISTTHSLTGALVGAGLTAVGADINLSVLGTAFFIPLVVSPLIAIVLGAGVYFVFRAVRIQLGISKEFCLCVGQTETIVPIPQPVSCFTMTTITRIETRLDSEQNCRQRYTGTVWKINSQKLLDSFHYLSAGLVCFARGLNDTPKIMAILMAAHALEMQAGLLLVGSAIALGGILHSRNIAETVGKKITPLNHGQGFSANLVTAFLVIFASQLGVPVSTTHVSVGAVFGIGAITRQANVKVVSEIALSWVLTLPIAAFFSACIYRVLRLYGL